MVLTRRAYRANMRISLWLPNEVLVQIIQQSPKADQATLFRVSKLFRDLCLPVLYRVVNLRPRISEFIESFCSGIAGNPSRAGAVRSFTLDEPRPSRAKPRSDLLLTPLKLMSKLTHLSIFAAALDDHHTCIILQKLFASRLGRVSLPNLEHYDGDANLILSIDSVIGLKAARLSWDSEDDAQIDRIIIKINSMTKSDLPVVSSHIYPDYPFQIMTSVSEHMRNAETLQLVSLENCIALLSRKMIRRITGCLQRLANLAYLEISSFPSTPGDTAKDLITIEGWAEACATLRACSFNRRGWRKIGGRWEEFPIQEFRVLAGLSDTSY
ncbi:hypothetical protein C8R45DRAFT_1207624 [Mycena sanguinolenta]|nr:hypothetical protein C8R45DRAFT_1207624 [Mycena sanguinolenta]